MKEKSKVMAIGILFGIIALFGYAMILTHFQQSKDPIPTIQYDKPIGPEKQNFIYVKTPFGDLKSITPAPTTQAQADAYISFYKLVYGVDK